VWSAVNCRTYGTGALLHFVRTPAANSLKAPTERDAQTINLLIEIKNKKPASRYARHWNET